MTWLTPDELEGLARENLALAERFAPVWNKACEEVRTGRAWTVLTWAPPKKQGIWPTPD